MAEPNLATLEGLPPQLLPEDVNRVGSGVLAINVVLLALATSIVTLRSYTRLWIKNVAGWDDTLIIAALVAAIIYTTGQMVQVYQGAFGHHIIFLTQSQVILDFKWLVVVTIFQSFSVFLSRASICLFLLRIFARIRRWTIFIYIAFTLNVLVFIGNLILYATICVPLDKLWNQIWDPMASGHCTNLNTFNGLTRFFSSLNCIVDFLCAVTPFLAIRTIQLEKRIKIGLYFVLGCGLVTAACSIGNAVSLKFNTPDPSYDLVPVSYWAAAEMYGAIMVASFPALRQLFAHVHETHTFSRSPGQTSGSSSRRGSGFMGWLGTPKSKMRSSMNPVSGESSGSRTKKASVPTPTIGSMDHDVSHSHGLSRATSPLRRQSNPSGGIHWTRDVYVELNDMEHGQAGKRDMKKEASGGGNFGGRERTQSSPGAS